MTVVVRCQERVRMISPDKVQVEPGNKVFFVGHAVGTQNYVCVASGAGVVYQLFTPEATLFNDEGRQLTTHFFSPDQNPDRGVDPKELGVIRATWEDSRDTSTVWGKVNASATSSTDPHFVEAGGDCLASCRNRWTPGRTHGRRQVGSHDVHPASEYRRRSGAFDRLCVAGRHRDRGIHALQGRLLLLPARRPVASRVHPGC